MKKFSSDREMVVVDHTGAGTPAWFRSTRSWGFPLWMPYSGKGSRTPLQVHPFSRNTGLFFVWPR